jgi:transposase
MDGETKYQVIKELVEQNGNKNRAANRLGCSRRSIDRYIKGYKTYGEKYFIHGNSGRKPAHALKDEVKNMIADLYRTKYYDATYQHFTELLQEFEDIIVSEAVVFEYKKKGNGLDENDTYTQFAYACKTFGIELKTTSVSQAKGRVERMFWTLQLRLPTLLRLAGAATIEQANAYLKEYLPKFN